MQIHELNNYNGNLDSNAFFAVDDGTDTGKVSAMQLLASTNAEITELENDLNGRIDNIIAGGDAPSAAEIVDARRGADGVDYASLGTAIRTQVKTLQNDVAHLKEFETRNIYSLINATDGYFISASDGEPYANSGVGYTDYLDLSEVYGTLQMLLLAPESGYITYQGAFYNDNKEYVSGYRRDQLTTDEVYAVQIPDNARYIRFSYTINRKSDFYIKGLTKNSKAYNYCKRFEGDIFTTIGATEGYYANSDTGALMPASGVSVTDFIPLGLAEVIKTIQATTNTHQGAFYDSNKNYVGGYFKYYSASAPEEFTIQIPLNAYYVRFSYLTNYASDYYAITDFYDIAEDPRAGLKRFSNMKMNCLGDSITYGYIPDSGAQMASPYPKLLKSILGLAECRNYGISGSTLAVNSGNYDPMSVRYAGMDDDADIVLVFGGTNDYGRAIYSALGSIADATNTTIYGALNVLCDGLITKYPKALIFLCTPLKRADKTGANGGGYTLEDVATAIRDVGEKFGMPVLDLNRDGGFYISNATFRAQYGGNDKLHPNQAFDQEHLAPMIARYIAGKM